MNTKEIIRNSFNLCATHYEAFAKIQKEIGNRLFERLDYLKINPRYVLDLGCGTGFFSALLKKRYPNACIVGLDLAPNMLKEAKKKQGFWRKWTLIQGDMRILPFADSSFDLIFANQVLHWAEKLPPFLSELNRVMHQNGCLLFSTLGPDTFEEIKQAFAPLDTFAHTNPFLDMHDIGDALVQKSFLDPVVDMERIVLHYPSLQQLLHSLKAQGVKNIHANRNKGLTGKRGWEQFKKNYHRLSTTTGKYPLTYEVIYGNAWKGQQRNMGEATETRIPLSEIKRKKT